MGQAPSHLHGLPESVQRCLPCRTPQCTVPLLGPSGQALCVAVFTFCSLLFLSSQIPRAMFPFHPEMGRTFKSCESMLK